VNYEAQLSIMFNITNVWIVYIVLARTYEAISYELYVPVTIILEVFLNMLFEYSINLEIYPEAWVSLCLRIIHVTNPTTT